MFDTSYYKRLDRQEAKRVQPTSMYELRSRRDFNTKDDFTILHRGSIMDCIKARCLSGDLLINTMTGKVVNHTGWLFTWEKLKLDCYARKAMRFDNA